MDFFINLAIMGLLIRVFGKQIVKENTKTLTEDCKLEFNIIKNIMDYTESNIFGNLNIKYGTLLLISGTIGVLLYKTVGLLMVLVILLILSTYLIKVVIEWYKFYKNFNLKM